MKKWNGGVLILALAAFILFIVSYTFTAKFHSPLLNNKRRSSSSSSSSAAYDFFNPPHQEQEEEPNSDSTPISTPTEQIQNLQQHNITTTPKPRYTTTMDDGLDDLYSLTQNLSSNALLAWRKMRFLFPRSDALSETAQGIKEAASMVKDLLTMIHHKEKYGLKAPGAGAGAGAPPFIDKACPHFVTTASLSKNESFLQIPCGLIDGSSVTLIGIPDSHQQDDSFQIELVGSQIKEEAAAIMPPPIILKYKVLLPGQNLTKEPVSIQNAWTQESGWGKDERCPHHGVPDNNLRVDGLVMCNTQILQVTAADSLNVSHSADRKLNNVSEGSAHASTSFHFVAGSPFTATLWAGDEGFHMTVNGRHETSFAYRERLEPWLVNRVIVKGGLKLVSLLANGLPVSEDVDLIADAKQLKAIPISNERLVLLIGVFSSGNNFERRMALRRTWMRYEAVRLGEVAVRFFIGLHKNKDVNFKLWREAQAYGDIQLMPFVDYYGLLTYKTIAICILGTKILSAQFIMKMDDDAFVRIDELLSSLKGKVSKGRLYGHISFDSSPHRESDNKWVVSEEEWPRSTYPPWAHGPGYVISQDIARFIVQGHKERELMLFKLEDVAVGIWIEQFGKSGGKIEYVNDDRFHIAGCEEDYILVHYQNPRMMLCLWEKLQLRKQQKAAAAECCE